MSKEIKKAQGQIRRGTESRVNDVVGELDNEETGPLEAKATTLLADLRAIRLVAERLGDCTRDIAVQQALMERGGGERAQGSLARLHEQQSQLTTNLLTLAGGLGG